MPLYLCIGDANAIPEATKEKIAKEVTAIHCGLTFAPPSFVHVYFLNRPPPPDRSVAFAIRAGIRADRSEEVKAKIEERMCDFLSRTLALERDQIEMTISESPGSWTMEGGHLLPEAGDEAAWMERHNAMLAEEGAGV